MERTNSVAKTLDAIREAYTIATGSTSHTSVVEEHQGTPYCTAPEVTQGELYDESADIWSLGITAYGMAKGTPPYYKLHAMLGLFLIPFKDPPRLDQTSGDCCSNSTIFHYILSLSALLLS